MGKRVTVDLYDDITEEVAPDVQKIFFALDGVNYSIDLGAKNAAKLRASLQPFVDAGTREGKAAAPRASRSPHGRPATREDLDAIRDWARANGRTVSDRGRVANDIQEAYDAAQAAGDKPVVKRAAPAAKKEDGNHVAPEFTNA